MQLFYFFVKRNDKMTSEKRTKGLHCTIQTTKNKIKVIATKRIKEKKIDSLYQLTVL